MYIAEASGYLDPGGGLCDAAGSLVLHWPTRERVRVIVGHSAHAAVRLYDSRRAELVEVPLAALRRGATLLRADELRRRLLLHTEAEWAIELVGGCTELWRMLYADGGGVEIYVEDPLPGGAHGGTAVLTATLEALSELYETHMSGIALPLVARRAVQEVARRPLALTGLLTAYFGPLGKVLPVRSQQRRTAARIASPHVRADVRAGEVHEAVELPDDCYLLGIHLPEENTRSFRRERKLATSISMAYSVIAARQGADPDSLARARRSGRFGGLPYAGFLGTIDYEWMYRDYERLLPETMRGADFLATYGQPVDRFVTVQPDQDYPLREAGLLPIRSNYRHQQLLDQLDRVAAGQLHAEEWTRQWGAWLGQTYRLQRAFGQVPARIGALRDYLQHGALERRLYGIALGAAHTPLLVALVYGEAALNRVEQRAREFGEAHGQAPEFLLP